ncbi:MAG: virulence factor SrfC family protein [Bacteroidales bacterium]|nr:virulence factor SrfC family protein [Bacteroidales bacterium]
MKTQDITENIALIDEALEWAASFNVQTFPTEVFKNFRRNLCKISESVSDEKTSGNKRVDHVIVNSLSVCDVLKTLLETYYNDTLQKQDEQLSYDVINQKVGELLPNIKTQTEQSFITEDEVVELCDYVHSVIGIKAAGFYQSDFCKLVAPVIKNISYDNLSELFSYAWNKNAVFTKIFESFVMKICTDGEERKTENVQGADLMQIRDEIAKCLDVFYVSENETDNNKKVQKTIGDIRALLDLNIGNNQELFGKIQDCMMVKSDEIRNVICNDLVSEKEEENTNSAIQLIRRQCEIDVRDSAEVNIEKLTGYYSQSQDELDALYASQGFSVKDVVSAGKKEKSTNDVVVKNIEQYWMQYINSNVQCIGKILPHAELITNALLVLYQHFNVSSVLSGEIEKYQSLYGSRASVNVIADYVTFELNKFVSTFGRAYMDFDAVKKIQEKAAACNVKIADVSPLAMNSQNKRMDVRQALTVLDQSEKIDFDNMVTLLNFSFWDNFPKWENFVTMGLLYVSDITIADSKANTQLLEMIKKCSQLYVE